MKIAVIFDEILKGGGGFQSLKSALLLKKLENETFKFYFVTPHTETNIQLKKNKLETILFKKTLLSKIFFHLTKSSLFNFLLKFFNFKNPLNLSFDKHNFNFIIFLGPSWYIKLCDKYNFAASIYDINFKIDNFFPEYKSKEIFNSKDQIVKDIVNHAYKIIVDTERSKNELVEIYNCNKKKINIQPFIPFLPSFDKLNKIDDKKIISNLGLNSKRYIFYPAQFWAHKNHKYILDAIEILNKQNLEIEVVFCGNNKGNLEYIKKLISEKKLKNKVHIFNFIKNEEVVSLYKNSLALVMPTYVARSTLPLYEAFYFKKPVFYSKNILDKNLEQYVHLIDLKNPRDLSDKIMNLINNEINIDKKINEAYDFFIKFCDEESFIENYRLILEEYNYLSSRWRD